MFTGAYFYDRHGTYLGSAHGYQGDITARREDAHGRQLSPVQHFVRLADVIAHFATVGAVRYLDHVRHEYREIAA